MAVRSRRLFAGTGIAAGGVLAWTVPADRTAILKDLSLRNLAGAAVNLTVVVDPAGATPAVAVHEEVAVPATGVRHITGMFVVLQEGDTVTIYGGAGGSFYGSGALLAGDPA